MNLNMGVSFYDDMAVMQPGGYPRSGLHMGPPMGPGMGLMGPGAVTGTSASLDPRPLSTAALIDPPMPPLPLLPPPQAPSLTAALRERIGLPLLAAGRRLPKPPLEGQRALNIPLFPRRPHPQSQKPERLTTRNRRLPKIPNPLSAVASGSAAASAAAASNANTLGCNSIAFEQFLGD